MGDVVASVGMRGAYAEETVVPAAQAVRVPDGVPAETAAALMLQGMTAHYLARTTFPLRAGHTCVVHAAAGGVGLLLVQMAKQAGARVLGTTSSEEKAALAREAGADEVVRYADVRETALQMTGGRGVDVVYDSVGQSTWEQSLASLGLRGMLVLYGQSSGPVPPIAPLVLAKSSLFLSRPTLFHYVATREELEWRAREVLEAARDGRLAVRIDRRVPLADAAEAHRALESRQTMGKLLLVP